MGKEVTATPAGARAAVAELQQRIESSILGQKELIRSMIVGLLADGHLLLESLEKSAQAHATESSDDDREKMDSRMRGNDGSEPANGTISQEAIFEARREIDTVHVAPAIEKCIVDLLNATRHADKYGEPLKKWIQIGASPRGGIGLDRASRVNAWLEGRDHVTPDDIRTVVHAVLRHRLILSYDANADGIDADRVIDELAKAVAVPA